MSRGSSFGRFTRASLALQVLLAGLLAAVAAVLAILVAERPALRLRLDLTESRRNTLDEQLVARLRALDQPLRLEVFFEERGGPLGGPTSEAQQRTLELFGVVHGLAPQWIEVEEYDLGGAGRAEAARRLSELGLFTTQKVVVSRGERREVLDLDQDLASFDLGDPDPRRARPPSLVSFRGEEALTEALLRLELTGTPLVLFATGHGEYSVDPVLGSGERALRSVSRLADDLRGEGYAVATWDAQRAPQVPAEGDVLAILGPEQPYPPEHAAAVQDFLDRGGRLVVAVDNGLLVEGDEGLEALLRRQGMALARGVVNVPLLDARGAPGVGQPECEGFWVEQAQLSSSHPITAPLHERRRRLGLTAVRSFDRGQAPFGGSLLELVVSPPRSWRDLPDETRGWDNVPGDDEERGPFALALAAEFPAAQPGQREARVVGLGGMTFLSDEVLPYNRDFVRNLFHWLADRDVRIRVAPRDPFEARLDVQRGPQIRQLSWFVLAAVPGSCVALGLWTAWRRRRS
jgi:hypothetical protein